MKLANFRIAGVVLLSGSIGLSALWAQSQPGQVKPAQKEQKQKEQAQKTATQQEQTQKKPTQSKAEDPAVMRARNTIKMLDDVYKTAVVLITDKYVHDEEDFPAGSAAIALFEAIEKKGWHSVRLIDVSGTPYDDKNVAKDDFEKQAAAKIKSGAAYVEEIQTGEKGRELLAMTAVPVVLAKCAMCHPHYKQVPEGQAIGAISYRMPIE